MCSKLPQYHQEHELGNLMYYWNTTAE